MFQIPSKGFRGRLDLREEILTIDRGRCQDLERAVHYQTIRTATLDWVFLADVLIDEGFSTRQGSSKSDDFTTFSCF